MPIWESFAIACGVCIAGTIAYAVSVSNNEHESTIAHEIVRAELLDRQMQSIMAEAERKMAERLSK